MRPTEGPKIDNDAIARASPAIDVGLLTTFACDGGFVAGRLVLQERPWRCRRSPVRRVASRIFQNAPPRVVWCIETRLPARAPPDNAEKRPSAACGSWRPSSAY